MSLSVFLGLKGSFTTFLKLPLVKPAGESLASLHGRLIALGWLGFDVGDRVTGIRYQLTRDGQRVLDGLVPIPTLRVVAATDDEETPSVDTDVDQSAESEVALTADSD